MLRKTLITLMAFAALSIGSTAMGMHGGGGHAAAGAAVVVTVLAVAERASPPCMGVELDR